MIKKEDSYWNWNREKIGKEDINEEYKMQEIKKSKMHLKFEEKNKNALLLQNASNLLSDWPVGHDEILVKMKFCTYNFASDVFESKIQFQKHFAKQLFSSAMSYASYDIKRHIMTNYAYEI